MSLFSVKIYYPIDLKTFNQAAMGDHVRAVIREVWEYHHPGGEYAVPDVVINWCPSHNPDHRHDSLTVEIDGIDMVLNREQQSDYGHGVFDDLVGSSLVPPTVGRKRLSVVVSRSPRSIAVTSD